MIRMLRVLVIILSLAVLLAGCGGGASQSPQVGQPAPDFKFQDAEGQSTSLSDLKGSPVLLNFWTTTCVYCAIEMPYLQQVYNDWRGKGLVLLAINIAESPSAVENFMQSQGLSLPVLLDSTGAITIKYGVGPIPTTFFIDSQGIVQYVRVGAFQSVAEIESFLSQLN